MIVIVVFQSHADVIDQWHYVELLEPSWILVTHAKNARRHIQVLHH